MSDNPFVGSWTYRSLLNDADLAHRLRRSRVRPRHDRDRGGADADCSRGTIGGPGWSLDAQRRARTMASRCSVRFQGTGIVGGEQWIYDYDGCLVPALAERRAAACPRSSARSCAPFRIPAARRRAAPPPIHPAGVVASWYAVTSASLTALRSD